MARPWYLCRPHEAAALLDRKGSSRAKRPVASTEYKVKQSSGSVSQICILVHQSRCLHFCPCFCPGTIAELELPKMQQAIRKEHLSKIQPTQVLLCILEFELRRATCALHAALQHLPLDLPSKALSQTDRSKHISNSSQKPLDDAFHS